MNEKFLWFIHCCNFIFFMWLGLAKSSSIIAVYGWGVSFWMIIIITGMLKPERG